MDLVKSIAVAVSSQQTSIILVAVRQEKLRTPERVEQDIDQSFVSSKILYLNLE